MVVEDTAAAAVAAVTAATRTGTKTAMLDMGLTTTRQATMHRTGRTIHPSHGRGITVAVLGQPSICYISSYNSARSPSPIVLPGRLSLTAKADGSVLFATA